MTDDNLALARDRGIAVIASPLDSYVTARMITLSAPSLSLMDREPVAVAPDDLVTGITDAVKDVDYRAAVVIDADRRPIGLVTRSDLVQAAREAGDAGFDVLIACAFNYEAHTTEFGRLGRIPVLKARMNADLHMAGDLKNTGKGNLFTVFGEPDIAIEPEPDGRIAVRINGIDVFDPNTGDIRSNDTDGIAAWFIDTDYNEESFFVRHAYFLGANDPYKSLKTALKAEIEIQ